MRADIHRVQRLEVIKEDTVETGKIAVRRPKPKDLRMLINMDPPNAKQALSLSNKVEVYYPKMNMVEEYELGKAARTEGSVVLLTFGSTSREMLKAVYCESGPSETVGGQKTTRLDLVPKDKKCQPPSLKYNCGFPMKPASDITAENRQAGGDYNQATYTNMPAR